MTDDLDRRLATLAEGTERAARLVPAAELRRRAGRRRARRAIGAGVAVAVIGTTAVAGGPLLAHWGRHATDPAVTSVSPSPTGPGGGGSYRDVLVVAGVTYVSTAQFETNAAYVGPVVASVRRATNEAARPGEADAAFLPVGTQVTQFSGYGTGFRLLAHMPQGWKVYESEVPASGARTGADVLDISGRVAHIDVLSAASGGTAVVGSVADAAQVRSVVDGLSAASLTSPTARPSFVVAFAMTDGTRVVRDYDAAAHVLGGIAVPPEVVRILASAIGP